MKKTRFTRVTALCLALLLLCGTLSVSVAAADTAASGTGTGVSADMKETLNSSSYSDYDAKHPQTKGSDTVIIDAKDVYSYSDGSTVYYYDGATSSFYSLDEKGERVPVAIEDLAIAFGSYGDRDALLSPNSGTITWQVEIPSSGRYAIELEYYPLGESTSMIERMFYLDGKVPFSQARYLSLSKVWEYDYPRDADGNITFKVDINGNQLKPVSRTAAEWMHYSFTAADGFYQEPFGIYFDNETNKTGSTHTISLAATREAMALKSIRIYPYEGLPTYAEVLGSYRAAGYRAAALDSYFRMEAETPYRVSDTSVYMANDRTSAITSPTSAGAQLLNVLGSNSYDTVGQWAAYRITVPETGLYTISVRCKQTALPGMYTSRAIRLAGGIYGDELAVPFKEAYNTRFNYNKSWQVVTLGDGTNVFQFYFEKGVEYTMSLDVSLGTLAETIETVESSLNVINNCYLEILKLTGAEPDQYRDYKFSRVMPATIRNILREYKNLTRVSEELTELCGSKGSHVATLDKIAYLLHTMGTQEDKIAENLDDLKSYIGTLGTWLNNSKRQSLMMDYIVVNGSGETTYEAAMDVKLDGQFRADANFFEAAGFEIASFFMSFVTDYNQMGVTEILDTNRRVEVWLATGRDQAGIWRNLIDSSFTSTEQGKGIAVDLKLVAGGTILPSVLAKQGPDVYMGLDSGSVINYAIRSAVLPVTEFVKRDPEVLNDFNEATLVPISMYNDIYGVPETVSFSMMFYRKDALVNLGLDVPQTWDDLLTAVPVLQSSNMEIGLSRDYNLFLYQRGGDRWKYEGRDYAGTKYADLMQDESFAKYFDYMEIGYDTNVALDAFKYMCRFYTDYSFPVTFDGANRFRTGEMPIMIADAVGMYNQLTVFATEIRGLWMFANVPGTKRSDGTISSVAIAGVSAVVMMNGVEDPEASWRFMKWQIGSDVQSTYGNSMVSLIGPSAKYNTANMGALFKMSWTSEEYANLYAQFNNLATIPNYPGAYIIDRYLNFAFLNAYNDGAEPVEQLQGYVKTINVEITRKRKEFDLPVLEDGETVDDSIETYLEYLKKLSPEELANYSEYVQNYVNGLK